MEKIIVMCVLIEARMERYSGNLETMNTTVT